MKEIIISKGNEGQRFDKYLGRYLDNAPKSFIYKMLRKKNIKLNDKKAEGNEMLKAGDKVNIYLSDETVDKFKNGDSKKSTLPPYTLDIVYESEDVLFVNKPVGMLSQKATKEDVSLNEYIVEYVGKGEDGFVPGVCNRLDRNTSGLVLAGKTLAGSQAISKLLKDRTLDKYYITIVAGVIDNEKTVDGYLCKNEENNKVAFSSKELEGYVPIKTKYIPITNNGEFTYVKVKLITGKTHQIRAHLASMGHPVIGDYKYGDRPINDRFKREYGLKYQLLHSESVVFPDMKDSRLPYLSGVCKHADEPDIFNNIKEDLF